MKLLLASVAASAAVADTTFVDRDLLSNWLGKVDFADNLAPSQRFKLFSRSVIDKTKSWASEWLGTSAGSDESEFPYFHWIPPYVDSAVVDGGVVSWSNECFKENSAKAVLLANNTIQLDITVGSPTGLLCSDLYLLGTVSSLAFGHYTSKGTHTTMWDLKSLTEAELWDIQTNGVRVFRFVDNLETSIQSLLSTANLFVSELTKGVPDQVAAANIDFLTKYSAARMEPRDITTVEVPETDIASGDFFGIIRLDGLDPMLAWAMGSTTGHTTTALWIDGELYIVESTAADSYWPVNGIQKTPYKEWLQMAREADYNLVHSPLKPEFRDAFDEAAALKFFESVEGVDYGYSNMLWGWVDTLTDNFPCVPPDYTQCLQPEHWPVLFGNLYQLDNTVGNMLISQAMNHRLGTKGLPLAGIMMEADKQGTSLAELMAVPEQDDWLYETTKYDEAIEGPSMVCCVFVCNMWKAGGLFDAVGDVNCAELTNWDDYVLTIFDKDPTKLPPQCASADPNNPICQLEGKYTLVLNDYSTKDPYAHMAETCPSRNPDYTKPPKC